MLYEIKPYNQAAHNKNVAMASHLESPTIQLLFSIPSKIITKHLPILQSSNRCKEAFSERPFIAYEKRPRNLPDLLVMAKLKQTKDTYFKHTFYKKMQLHQMQNLPVH